MELFLVQHGESKSEADDPERALTERGAETVRRMATWAVRVSVKVAQIRHSGKKRAEQTAAILAEQLHPSKGVLAVTGLNPNDEVHPVAQGLRGEQEALMLVGHLPFLSRLVGLLVVGDPLQEVVGFRYAGMVCLARQDSQWIIRWVMLPELVGTAPAKEERLS